MEHIGIDTHGLDQPENKEFTDQELDDMWNFEQEIDDMVVMYFRQFGIYPEIAGYTKRIRK